MFQRYYTPPSLRVEYMQSKKQEAKADSKLIQNGAPTM
jgi:hypothetical protein